LENGLIHVVPADLYVGNWCYTGHKHIPRLEPSCWGQENRRVTWVGILHRHHPRDVLGADGLTPHAPSALEILGNLCGTVGT
jgi:hypothetical protein